MGVAETQLQSLQLTVTLDEARQQHLASAQAIVADANALVVDSPQMAEYANGVLKDVKQRKARIEAMHEDIVGPIRLALSNARKWFTPAIEANDQAEKIIKDKMQAFTAKERDRIAAEQKLRDDAARRAREEAEIAAAAARARAEAAAAEARRKAEEATVAEAKAKAEGNSRAAAAAAAERAKQEETEKQRLAEGERKATELQLTASAITTAAPPQATKLAGFGERKNWIAELAPDTTAEQAKEKVVAAIAGGRKDLLALVSLDMKSAAKLAKALETNFNVPGLRARNEPIPTSRG